MAGKTDDNVEELEILTYGGLRMRAGKTGDLELARIMREGGRRFGGIERLVRRLHLRLVVAERVVVGIPIAYPLNGVEAEKIYQNLEKQTIDLGSPLYKTLYGTTNILGIGSSSGGR